GQDPEEKDGAADRDVAGHLLSPARPEEASRALQGGERAGALERYHRHGEEGDQRPADGEHATDDLSYGTLILQRPEGNAARRRGGGRGWGLAEAPGRNIGRVADGCRLPAEDHVGCGGQADAEVGADYGEQVEADHRHGAAEDRLVVLDQVDARADDDERAD